MDLAAQFGVFPLLILLSKCLPILVGYVEKVGTIGTGYIFCVLDRLSNFFHFFLLCNAFLGSQILRFWGNDDFCFQLPEKEVPFVCSLSMEWPFPSANSCSRNTRDCFPFAACFKIFQICLINSSEAFKLTWENTDFCRLIFSWIWSRWSWRSARINLYLMKETCWISINACLWHISRVI